jgi:putative endonuclease
MKLFRPWVIVYKESFETKTEARKRENQIKRYKGGQAFKKLLGVGTEVVKRGRL